MEGDLDVLIQTIESVVDAGTTQLSLDENLFIHKYLAVAYAKYPEKKELAKYHMLRLLEGRPSANLYDMSASDEVYGIFDRVKAEHHARTGINSDPSVNPATAAQSTSSSNHHREKSIGANPESKAHLYWIGGLAAVGAGVGLTLYLWPEPEPKVIRNRNPIEN
jgi:hypothetical protein